MMKGKLFLIIFTLVSVLSLCLTMAVPVLAAHPPSVSSISPSTGPLAGGTTVTITGTSFANGATVSIGGNAATSVTVVNATTITATTPSGTAGPQSIVITNPDGHSSNTNIQFTYTAPPPTITAISPNSGPSAGGTSVTIIGTGFVIGATVSIGGNAATNVTVVSATTITATTPSGTTGAKSVVVTNPDTQSSNTNITFTYAPSAPTVTAISPSGGPLAGGTTVTITGTGFVTTGTVTVTIGGNVAANVTVVSATTITATTPSGTTGAKSVVVTNPDTQSSNSDIKFTYTAAAPTIISISPSGGPAAGATSVTITGTGFLTGATVTIGGNAATNVTVVSATTITATTPSGTTGAKSVVITNPDTQSSNSDIKFTYAAAAPTIISISPSGGPAAGATSITITGTGFMNGATVSIGATPATGVTVVNATTITATTLAGTGAQSVVVTNPDTQSSNSDIKFTYTAAAPTIISISPSGGPAAGGTSVTITGTSFANGATVSIGGNAATSVTVVNATTVTATTPSGTTGAKSVVVTNPDTQSSNTNIQFTYAAAAPTITAISPSSGPAAGATIVTINGTGFVTGATVTIGGNAATSVTVVNATTITATTPSGTTGAKSVVVTNPDTQSSNSDIKFTYTAAAPTVTAISPSSGPAAGATSVTITGTGFVTGATVTIGGNAATSVTVVNATTITATTPGSTTGAKSVVVTNPDTQSSNTNIQFTYAAAAPTVTAISPSSGPAAGGTSVTITGTGFVNGATVTIGGNAATSVTVVNATTITATTPSGTAGPHSVTVTNPDTQSSNTNINFNYIAGGGGGGGPTGPTTIAGITDVTSIVNPKGIFNQDTNAFSGDNNVLLAIPSGTTGLTSGGASLTQISMIHMTTPPALPVGAGIVSLVYDLLPSGTTFNPPAIIRFSYDPTLIPAGVAETSLEIAYYDSTVSRWITLTSVVDTANHFISAQVIHFTPYSVTYGVKTATPAPTTTATITTTTPSVVTTTIPPAITPTTTLAVITTPTVTPHPATFEATSLIINPGTIEPSENVNIYVRITNTSDVTGTYAAVLKVNNLVVDTKNVTLDGGVSTIVTFTTSSNLTGNCLVEVAGLSGSFRVSNKTKIPWFWPGVTGAIVLGGLLGVLIGRWLYSKR